MPAPVRRAYTDDDLIADVKANPSLALTSQYARRRIEELRVKDTKEDRALLRRIMTAAIPRGRRSVFELFAPLKMQRFYEACIALVSGESVDLTSFGFDREKADRLTTTVRQGKLSKKTAAKRLMERLSGWSVKTIEATLPKTSTPDEALIGDWEPPAQMYGPPRDAPRLAALAERLRNDLAKNVIKHGLPARRRAFLRKKNA